MKQKRTEITIEIHEVLRISRRGVLREDRCPVCGRQAAMMSLQDVCMSGLSIEAVRRQAETGRLHLIERAAGSLLICLTSLLENWKEN